MSPWKLVKYVRGHSDKGLPLRMKTANDISLKSVKTRSHSSSVLTPTSVESRVARCASLLTDGSLSGTSAAPTLHLNVNFKFKAQSCSDLLI